jgi:phosphoribosylaminoimidazole-succinocarboxamide synthase
MGKEGQSVPEMNEEWVNTISNRYIELYEKVTGEKFHPQRWTHEKTLEAITKSLEQLGI